MQYVWSDIPTELIHVLTNCDPKDAAEVGEAYCEKRGVQSRLGTGQGEPALLTFRGMSRWLHSPRRLIDVSTPSVELLQAWEPRFDALPMMEDRPWQKGVMFHLGRGTPSDTLVYAEPLEGNMPGIRYVVWSRLSDGTWGTSLPKFGTSDDLDTFYYWDTIVGEKSKLAISPDGTRIPLDPIRKTCVNALAALFEDPIVLFGMRQAKTARGTEGKVHRVHRQTLNYDGARLITKRWAELDAAAKAAEVARVETKSRPHISPCLHTVEPHHWRVWVNALQKNETSLETRKRTREDGTQFVQYRVSRLRGKDGAYTRGNGVRPHESRLVTGPDDL
jgi:hypothetical protein